MITINQYLTNLASNYFIGYGTTERSKIDTSIATLIKNLKSYFGDEIKDVKVFGSYQRDTILPRKYDSKSDVDIMIIFDHDKLNLQPKSYRQKIVRFVSEYYWNSLSKMDFPTVRIDLLHITLDLIPTKVDGFFGMYYIPDRNNQWMTTDPDKFTKDLQYKNTSNSYVVKPVIRLVKSWNAGSNYPYESFKLEKKIEERMFWAGKVEEDFFGIVDYLSSWDLDSQGAKEKLMVFKNAISYVKDYLKQNNEMMAKKWLHRVLPE